MRIRSMKGANYLARKPTSLETAKAHYCENPSGPPLPGQEVIPKGCSKQHSFCRMVTPRSHSLGSNWIKKH